MTRFTAIVTSVMLAVFWLPVIAMSDETGIMGQQPAADTSSQTGSTPSTRSVSKDKAVKKPDQKDVQSRGLFAKKKKKQVGGSAGHSQSPEETDSSMPDGPGRSR